eukprot:TRINITY_DN1512_c0_g1_i3.p2 TRINITY_DN1512_c0_g1~~TRINITY_DN1512_c0_g1_i3.p2  ORF type:complete len:234 (+),score=60.88 TRINITY_DN1512_c0_g1_i3:3439-4140(+)
MPPPPMLVTWDIDGTLLCAAPPGNNRAHKNAIDAAVHAVHGARVSVDDVPHVGGTDLAIIRRMCTLAKVPPVDIDAKMPRVLEHAKRVVRVEHGSHLVLPGVVSLLTALRERGVTCALTTGNMGAIARLKLNAAGLLPFFDGGAFGDECEKRADILRLAVRRCAPHVSLASVVHVGDAVSDVRAANEVGAASVAVATGAHDKELLAAEHPTLLVDDLSDTRAVLSALGFASAR